MTDLWVARPIRLEYLLGEIPLFVIRFPGLEFDAHFTSLTTNLDETRPPFAKLSPEVEAIFVRSHPINGELPQLEVLPQAIRYVPARYHRYYVDLRGSFQEYLNKFSSKSRSTLQRKVRKFSDFCKGQIPWREFSRVDEMEEFHRLAREVSKKTYQEKLLNFGMPEGEEFKRELLDLAARDLVRGYILFSGTEPIAYLYCPLRDGVLFYRYLGYDPESRDWSPGTVLQYLVLERLFSEGKFRMFDFTEGEGAHKEFFSTGNTWCADVYFLRRTLRNLLLLRLHSGLRTLSGAAVRVLDRLGVKSRIKKLIRKWW
jgi:CelD/BcsL family acetyltransferase involved in cellulose biosynthesis